MINWLFSFYLHDQRQKFVYRFRLLTSIKAALLGQFRVHFSANVMNKRDGASRQTTIPLYTELDVDGRVRLTVGDRRRL